MDGVRRLLSSQQVGRNIILVRLVCRGRVFFAAFPKGWVPVLLLIHAAGNLTRHLSNPCLFQNNGRRFRQRPAMSPRHLGIAEDVLLRLLSRRLRLLDGFLR